MQQPELRLPAAVAVLACSVHSATGCWQGEWSWSHLLLSLHLTLHACMPDHCMDYAGGELRSSLMSEASPALEIAQTVSCPLSPVKLATAFMVVGRFDAVGALLKMSSGPRPSKSGSYAADSVLCWS